jgi:hypothetical protein
MEMSSGKLSSVAATCALVLATGAAEAQQRPPADDMRAFPQAAPGQGQRQRSAERALAQRLPK